MKKRISLVFLLFGLLMLTTPLSVLAQEGSNKKITNSKETHIVHDLDGGSVWFKPSTGAIIKIQAEGDITIPSAIEGVPVTMMGEGRSIVSGKGGTLIIPDSVKTISNKAFYGAKFTNIVIPNSVTTIEEGAFYKSSVQKITIPNSVTKMGTGLFTQCKDLVEVDLQEGITVITDQMFRDCTALQKVNIPNTVRSIGKSAFNGCKALTEIEIPDSVQFLGGHVFQRCTNLKEISIPYGVIEIGMHSFDQCVNLTDVTIPVTVGRISDYAFAKCENLDSVHYGATEVEWELIQILQPNKPLEGAYIYYTHDDSKSIDIDIEVDSDGDGLLNDWEINGYDFDGDGVVDVPLNKMGADPNKKDIFVEIDWTEFRFLDNGVETISAMKQDNGSIKNVSFLSIYNKIYPKFFNDPKVLASCKPSQNVLNMVQKAFEKHNINLHLDAGPDSIMNYKTGEKWGELSGGNSILLENRCFIPFSSTDENRETYTLWKELIKENFDFSREAVFKHAVFVDLVMTPDESIEHAGLSMGTPDRYFIVAAGSVVNSSTGKVDELALAGTLMHELGHTLGLKHGGQDDINHKPNYLSVMNYMFQFKGLQGTNELNYSEYALPVLDENNLNEKEGIDPEGLTEGTGLGSMFYTVGKENNMKKINVTNIAKKSVDFNHNYKKDESDYSYEDGVKYDLNQDGNYEKLYSYTDWDKLIFNSN